MTALTILYICTAHIKLPVLHCLSWYSFLRGAAHPNELVERAAALGYAALAITDQCSLAGIVKAYVAAIGSIVQRPRNAALRGTAERKLPVLN